MAFATVLVYLAVVYVRPGEIIPGWEGFPFALITQIVSAAAVALSLALTPRRFWNQPHDWYVLGFFAAAVASNAAWGWFGGASMALGTITPVLLCYFLIRAAVRSRADLRWVGYALVAMSLFQAVNGISQFRTGVGLGGVSVLTQSSDERESQGETEPDADRRIRGTGIFNDPNDLAMALVAVIPFLLGPMLSRQSLLSVRILALVLLWPIIAALFYTNSRGGLLGFGAVLAAYSLRFGRATGTLVAIAVLTALVTLGPARLGQVNAEEDSAQGRVQSWSAGLQMFKSHPILGVGFGRYTEFNDLVAHNSFVHSLAELGLVGAFCFAGIFYWAFLGSRGMSAPTSGGSELDALRAWTRDLQVGTFGLLVCAMFLSRQYAVVTVIWIALGACSRQVLQEAGSPVKSARTWDVVGVAAATVCGVASVYVAVRLLAVWS